MMMSYSVVWVVPVINEIKEEERMAWGADQTCVMLFIAFLQYSTIQGEFIFSPSLSLEHFSGSIYSVTLPAPVVPFTYCEITPVTNGCLSTLTETRFALVHHSECITLALTVRR